MIPLHGGFSRRKFLPHLQADSLLGYLDGDVFARYKDCVTSDILDGRRRESLAGAKIELCAVPWTDHTCIAHNAFAQGTAIVRAVVVDRMDCSANVKHRYGPASDLNPARAARRKILCRCDLVKRHNRYQQDILQTRTVNCNASHARRTG